MKLVGQKKELILQTKFWKANYRGCGGGYLWFNRKGKHEQLKLKQTFYLSKDAPLFYVASCKFENEKLPKLIVVNEALTHYFIIQNNKLFQIIGEKPEAHNFCILFSK